MINDRIHYPQRMSISNYMPSLIQGYHISENTITHFKFLLLQNKRKGCNVNIFFYCQKPGMLYIGEIFEQGIYDSWLIIIYQSTKLVCKEGKTDMLCQTVK